MKPEPLLEVCERLIKWLDQLAARDDENAKSCGRFPGLQAAYIADAQNFRATAASIRKAIKKAGAA